MRPFFEHLIFFWKPDVEFISSLSVDTCQNRLEDLGANTYEGRWFLNRSKGRRIGFSLKGRDYSFFKGGPWLSGELREIKKGTKVTFTFEPSKPYLNIDILLIASLFLVFYQKDFLLAFFAVFVLLMNVELISKMSPRAQRRVSTVRNTRLFGRSERSLRATWYF
jgi:hypothetical protein